MARYRTLFPVEAWMHYIITNIKKVKFMKKIDLCEKCQTFSSTTQVGEPMTMSPDKCSISYRKILTADALAEMEPEWNDLLARSGVGTIYLTWEYLWTWWNVYGKEHELCVLTARDEAGALCGIAPMAVGPGQGKRRFLRHLTFMGGLCDSTSECQDFIIDSPNEDEIITQFCSMLSEADTPSWDFASLPAVFKQSSVLRKVRGRLEMLGEPEVQVREAPFAELPCTWDEYLQGRSPKFRSTIQNRLSKLDKNHQWEYKIAGKDMPLSEAYDILLRLNSLRWGEENQSFHNPEFVEFHRRLMPLFHAKGWLAMAVLFVDGVAAAVRYDFIYGGKIWGFQGGWETSFAKLSIGTVMNALTFKWAIEERGLREYDFGVEVSRYKTEWADCSRDIIDFTVPNPHSKAAWFFLKARSIIKQPGQALSGLPSLGKMVIPELQVLRRLL